MIADPEAPLCIDLYCGLGGWAEGFLAEGYRVIGFDIERHQYAGQHYPGWLVLQDVLTLHGRQIAKARVIVASPPCTEPSYRAMPWSRARALNEAGPPTQFIELFNACWRLQREASEAAGRHIPLIIENVKGAQRWVGPARAHFGSYYLWGDVGCVGRSILVGRISFGQYLRADRASKNSGGSSLPLWPGTSPEHLEDEGVKQRGSGKIWFDVGIANLPSSSPRRRQRSAEVAKIPLRLARYIAGAIR